MANTCTLSYLWDWETYIKANRYGKQYQLRPSFQIAISVMSILLSIASIFIVLDSSTDLPTRIYMGGVIIWAIYWLFFRRKCGEWIYRRKFKKQDVANKKVEWEISDAAVASHCEDLYKTEMSWLFFDKIVEAPDGFLLYLKKTNTFFWLPYDKFNTPGGPEIIRKLAKENNLIFQRIH